MGPILSPFIEAPLEQVGLSLSKEWVRMCYCVLKELWHRTKYEECLLMGIHAEKHDIHPSLRANSRK